MNYRVTFRSNPRLIILAAIGVMVATTAILVLFAFGTLPGVVALLIAFYIVYQIVKLLRLQLASYVDVSNDGVVCVTSAGETIAFSWDSVSHAGICVSDKRKESLFLYDEENDKLITVPDSFAHMAKFAEEVGAHVELPRYQLAATETVRDHVRSLVPPSRNTSEEVEDD